MRQLLRDRVTSVRLSRPRVVAAGLSIPLWLIAALLGCFALLPRVLNLDDFFTIDESYHWIGRVQRFSEALYAGTWALTDQTGHPGVTTMWLGTLGRWSAALANVHDPGWAGGGAAYLAILRLPLAVVNSLAIVVGYLVLRRLLRARTALLSALFWSASPLLVAHSRLLHLDALVTSFMTLSLLLLLVATKRGVRGQGSGISNPESRTENQEQQETLYAGPTRSRVSLALVGSGVCAGLALLTKAPSLLLLPTVGLLLVALSAKRSLWDRLLEALWPYTIWLGVAVLIVFIGWPALWTAPIHAVSDVVHEIIFNGGEPTDAGNYFWGQPVPDPGWLFYPAVVLWRTTPWTLIGLLLLPLTLRQRGHERRVLLALLGYACLFGLIMSIEPKKFDRYLLPIWSSLEILAAAGWGELLDILCAWSTSKQESNLRKGFWALTSRLSVLALPLVVLTLAANLVWYHPYYLGYFNPLLGGGANAQKVMLVGWGEGMERVGAWLSVRPDLKRGPVLSWIPPTLAPFVPKSTLVLDLREQYLSQASSYAVLYSRSVQRKESAVAEAYVRQTPALFTLRRYGIEYASVHQLPRPFTDPVDAIFGAGLHLRGFSQKFVGSTLVITPSWDIQTNQPGGQFCFVHVLTTGGTRVAQVDAPLDQGMFATWQAGQQFDSPLPVPLPANLPSGEYQVVMGLYRPTENGRLRLTQGPSLPAQIDGPEVLRLTKFRWH